MKRNTPLRQKTPLQRKTPLKASTYRLSSKKRSSANFKRNKGRSKVNEEWVRAIPEGDHGSGTYQKRLWKLVSDFVRIRDWYTYERCVATGSRIQRWQDGQAGHFKAYSVCNGMFKFDETNIHLQSAISNKLGHMEDGSRYGKELQKRFGENILWEIDYNNAAHRGEKITKQMILDKMCDIISLMGELQEQPVYYRRVCELMLKAT